MWQNVQFQQFYSGENQRINTVLSSFSSLEHKKLERWNKNGINKQEHSQKRLFSCD